MSPQQPYHDAPEVVPGHDSPEVNYAAPSYGEGLETAQPGKEVVNSNGVVEYYGKDYEGKEAGAPTAPKNRICGLSRRAFWIVLVVGIVVVIGAVGGGVGGALAGKKSSSSTTGSGSAITTSGSPISQSTTPPSSSSSGISSSTTSPSSTTTAQATTTITVAVATDMAGCPLVNATIFSAPSGSKFKKVCYYDILGTSIDIHMVKVSTFDSCIGLCDSYNTEHGKGNCKSVVWDLLGGYYQDCWLKNATGVLTQNGVVGTANGTVAAILQS